MLARGYARRGGDLIWLFFMCAKCGKWMDEKGVVTNLPEGIVLEDWFKP